MSLLPFGDLPVHRPRKLVPPNADLGDWDAVSPLFDRLEAELQSCQSVEDLERWIEADGELSAALDEENTRRYIAMTCHTDN